MNQEVTSLIKNIEIVFSATETNLQAMSVGERIQMKDLTAAVGLAVAKDPKDILPFVSYFVHNTSLAYVSRGKNGGIIRGAKSVKNESTQTV